MDFSYLLTCNLGCCFFFLFLKLKTTTNHFKFKGQEVEYTTRMKQNPQCLQTAAPSDKKGAWTWKSGHDTQSGGEC